MGAWRSTDGALCSDKASGLGADLDIKEKRQERRERTGDGDCVCLRKCVCARTKVGCEEETWEQARTKGGGKMRGKGDEQVSVEKSRSGGGKG